MNSYSITIRPHKTTFDLIEKSKILFFEYLKKGTIKYSISYEKGKNDYYNHFQCFFQYDKDRRQDKIREGIIKYLFKLNIELDPEERKYGIKIKEVKTNLEGVIGYTFKEGGKVITNFTSQEQEQYKKIYLDHLENNKLDKSSYFRTNQKNYHIYIRNFINENIQFIKDTYDNEDIKLIIGEMINRGYYFTFLNSRNVIERILYVKCFLNKKGNEFVNYIYDKNERNDTL